jgi:hypothetical protein
MIIFFPKADGFKKPVVCSDWHAGMSSKRKMRARFFIVMLSISQHVDIKFYLSNSSDTIVIAESVGWWSFRFQLRPRAGYFGSFVMRSRTLLIILGVICMGMWLTRCGSTQTVVHFA